MKIVESKASIVIKDNGLTYNICTLIQSIKGESFSYTYIPNRNIIKLLSKGLFEGIQGIDLDVNVDKYVRDGIPVFVSERVPPKNREGLYELLDKVGLDYYDPLQYMLRTSERYFGDNLEVVEYIFPKSVDIDYRNVTNLYPVVKEIVSNIALSNNVTISGNIIDPQSYFEILYPIYLNLYKKKLEAQKKSASNRKYRGRKPKNIKEDEFNQIYALYKAKEITLRDALRIMNISRSTFIRRAKLFQK